jgi:hypothetical protein
MQRWGRTSWRRGRRRRRRRRMRKRMREKRRRGRTRTKRRRTRRRRTALIKSTNLIWQLGNKKVRCNTIKISRDTRFTCDRNELT